jgi:hypothetical protein
MPWNPLDGAVGEGVARGALHPEEGHDVARARALDVLQLVAVHAHQPRHLQIITVFEFRA